MFIAEAKKYQVFPMDASVAARIVAPRPNITAGRTEFVYTSPMVGLPQGDSPFLLNSSYTITADIDVPEGGAEGMILTSGGRFAGYGFYLLKGKPVFLWNLIDLKRIKWEGPDALTPGKHTVEFDFKYDGLGVGTLAFNNMSGLGRPGTGTLKVDGKVVATQTMAHTLPMILQWDESFDIGSDTLTGVNDADYTAAVHADRQAQQADAQGGPPAAHRGGHQEARECGSHRGGRQAGSSHAERAAVTLHGRAARSACSSACRNWISRAVSQGTARDFIAERFLSAERESVVRDFDGNPAKQTEAILSSPPPARHHAPDSMRFVWPPSVRPEPACIPTILRLSKEGLPFDRRTAQKVSGEHWVWTIEWAPLAVLREQEAQADGPRIRRSGAPFLAGGGRPFLCASVQNRADENLDVGSDTGTPVDDTDCKIPFAFNGKIDKITLTIDRPKLTPEDEQEADGGAAQQQDQRVASSDRAARGPPPSGSWPAAFLGSAPRRSYSVPASDSPHHAQAVVAWSRAACICLRHFPGETPSHWENARLKAVPSE